VKKIFYSCLVLFLLSCGKEELSGAAPSMIGTWVHYSAVDAWEKISINSDGDGKIEWYTNGKLFRETKNKTWYVKTNRLFFGKATFNVNPYDIKEYPVLSPSTMIDGFDTLLQNRRFCVLDDKNFVEKL
jgi:hypothetical protein